MTRSSFQRGYVSNPIRTRSGLVFEIRYRIRNGEGTWKHKSERLHGLKNKSEARAALEKKLREAAIQTVTPNDLTMQSFVDQYWTSYLDRIEAKPSTRKSYGSILKHLLPSIGQLKLAQVAPLHIEQLVQARTKQVSAKTLLNELGLLQSIFSLAVENDLIVRSPVRSKHKPKVIHSEKPIWTPEQVKRILAALPEQHRVLFTCGALTGLKSRRIAGIDLAERQLWRSYDQDPKQPLEWPDRAPENGGQRAGVACRTCFDEGTVPA